MAHDKELTHLRSISDGALYTLKVPRSPLQNSLFSDNMLDAGTSHARTVLKRSLAMLASRVSGVTSSKMRWTDCTITDTAAIDTT